jgi:hypothetical protein
MARIMEDQAMKSLRAMLCNLAGLALLILLARSGAMQWQNCRRGDGDPVKAISDFPGRP